MKAFMNWSGGKDSALSFYKAQQQNRAVEVLVTSVNKSHDRVSMHGVPRELLVQQAAVLGLPLRTIELPELPGMETYEATVRDVHRQLKNDGFTHGVFGDIFLEDLKSYREELLAKDNLQCLFPLWQMKPEDVVQQFLELRFKALVVCVNSAHLDQSFCGRLLDESFFQDLPSSIDPCGENGEYHSFVFDGPNFAAPIRYTKGDVVLREYPAPKGRDDCFTPPQPACGFYFCDLLPG